MVDSELRSSASSAYVEFQGSGSVTVLPFSSLRFAEAANGVEISVDYGHLAFKLVPQSQIEILTQPARLEYASGRPAAGELFVSGAGLMGLKMSLGSLNVRARGEPKRVVLASLEPVFLPAPPSKPGDYFMASTPMRPPRHAKGVYTPSGQSIGYLGGGGVLVIYPGFTNDLTRPFSPKLVRLAMRAIPEKDRTDDATPLFDVNGGYLGYLAGQVFVAQAQQQTAPAQQGTPATGAPETGTSATTGATVGATHGMSAGTIAAIGAGTAVVIGGAIGIASAAGGSSGSGSHSAPLACPPTMPAPATPPAPSSGQPAGCP